MTSNIYVKEGSEFKNLPNYVGMHSTNNTIIIKEIKRFKWCEDVLEETERDLKSGWLTPELCQNKCDAYCSDICKKTSLRNSKHVHAVDENGNAIEHCQQGNPNYDKGCYKEIKSLSK